MGLLESFRSCFGIRSGSQAATAEAPALSGTGTPATSLANRAVQIPATGSPRAPAPGGWLSSVRTWAQTLCCGFSRTQAVPHESVYRALQAAGEHAQEPLDKLAVEQPQAVLEKLAAEFTGKRIGGTYDLNKTSREEHALAGLPRLASLRRGAGSLRADLRIFKALRQADISLEQVKLRGEILLPNRPNEDAATKAAITLVSELGGQTGQPGKSSHPRPDTTGVKVRTADGGVNVEEPAQCHQLARALGCHVKVGRIKLTGTVKSLEEWARLQEIVRLTTDKGGKLDLNELRVSVDVLFPPLPENSEELPDLSDTGIQRTLALLQALKTHGARLEEPSGRCAIKVGDDSNTLLGRLQGLASLVDRSSGRPLQNLRLLVDPTPLLLCKPPAEVMRVLKKLSAAGAAFTLASREALHISVKHGELDQLQQIISLPDTSCELGIRASIRNPQPLQVTRAQAEQLKDLHQRGISIDREFTAAARAVGVDLNAR